MLNSQFLRHQADNCIRIARSCFDLASAEHLRLMARELNDKAAEMDQEGRRDKSPSSFLGRSQSS
jgi:hypothetical protein